MSDDLSLMDLSVIGAFKYVSEHIYNLAKAHGSTDLFLLSCAVEYSTIDSKKAFLKHLTSFLSSIKELDPDDKKKGQAMFNSYYDGYLREVKPSPKLYCMGMLKSVDKLLDKYAKSKGWYKEFGNRRKPEKLFCWTGNRRRREYFVFTGTIWEEVDFSTILKFYYQVLEKYLDNININQNFEGQFEILFAKYYPLISPFVETKKRENTVLVTEKGNTIEIDPKNASINVNDFVNPSMYLTEVINLDPSQEEINEAITTDPIEYFERAPIHNYRRVLKLTLGIKQGNVETYEKDPVVLPQDKETFYGGIASVLTSIAYGFINNPGLYGMNFRKFFYNYGKTGTGKSTHFDILNQLFPKSVVSLEGNQILGDESRFQLYKIFFKRWAQIDEGDGQHLNPKELSRAKLISARGQLTADRKNKSSISGNNYALLFYSSNALPPTGDKAFINRTHIDEWLHDLSNKNDPRNEGLVSIEEMIEKEGKHIFLCLLSFLSKLLKEKKIPTSIAHDKIKKLQEVETGGPLMRWYYIANSDNVQGEEYILIDRIYDNFKMFFKIQEHPERAWWEKKAKDKYRGMSFDLLDLNKEIKNSIIEFNPRRRIPSRKALIEFLYGRGHKNQFDYEKQKFVILFPNYLPNYERFFGYKSDDE
ncbi:MAG: DUF5906 domain-containing protein [Acidimicrobiaceae bacterium]|nr:DUF5906 domain-containing protein [Acidimicrobiaceae bacterium]